MDVPCFVSWKSYKYTVLKISYGSMAQLDFVIPLYIHNDDSVHPIPSHPGFPEAHIDSVADHRLDYIVIQG
jgi:hypothetical protein